MKSGNVIPNIVVDYGQRAIVAIRATGAVSWWHANGFDVVQLVGSNDGYSGYCLPKGISSSARIFDLLEATTNYSSHPTSFRQDTQQLVDKTNSRTSLEFTIMHCLHAFRPFPLRRIPTLLSAIFRSQLSASNTPSAPYNGLLQANTIVVMYHLLTNEQTPIILLIWLAHHEPLVKTTFSSSTYSTTFDPPALKASYGSSKYRLNELLSSLKD
ncbi:hypothetical protein L1987_24359 [Smallanthus sonchifolius]|uniref:Uncharacterized protein n=1 Tax=Smallanthus sonchifolius TaxID=185202 RepID=A0ACB9IL40_9ASTR|nr:hypothetical protein L1987_24359 [Smallanthus sonchifolius]